MRALLALMLAGCVAFPPATKPIEISAKDGARALFVECRKTLANCYQAAEQQCGGAYIPLEDNRRTSIQSDSLGPYSVSRFELTFRCK